MASKLACMPSPPSFAAPFEEQIIVQNEIYFKRIANEIFEKIQSAGGSFEKNGNFFLLKYKKR